MNRKPSRIGFTLVEVLALLIIVAIVAMVFLPRMANRHRPAHGLRCVSNLKNVGLAFRIYATDNDRFPGEGMLSNGVPLAEITASQIYRSLSDELSTPKIVFCSADKERSPGEKFPSLEGVQISYFASVNANERTPKVFLAGDRNLTSNGVTVRGGLFPVSKAFQLGWSEEIHNGTGNMAWADGSVQQFVPGRLVHAAAEQAEVLATNHLVIP